MYHFHFGNILEQGDYKSVEVIYLEVTYLEEATLNKYIQKRLWINM